MCPRSSILHDAFGILHKNTAKIAPKIIELPGKFYISVCSSVLSTSWTSEGPGPWWQVNLSRSVGDLSTGALSSAFELRLEFFVVDEVDTLVGGEGRGF